MAWTCQRQAGGLVCKHVNPNRKRKCERCGKTRPPRTRPAHLIALEREYSDFVALNGGEFCAICGRPPSQVRRLDRDHCHDTGEPRGLLCARCNRALPRWCNSDWLRKAADYLDKSSLPKR